MPDIEARNVNRLRRIAAALGVNDTDEAVLSLRNLFPQMLQNLQSASPDQAEEAYNFFLIICGRFDEFFPKQIFVRLQHLEDGLFNDIACDAINAFHRDPESKSIPALLEQFQTHFGH